MDKNPLAPQPALFVGGPYDGRRIVVEGYRHLYTVRALVHDEVHDINSNTNTIFKYEEIIYERTSIPREVGLSALPSIFVAPGLNLIEELVRRYPSTNPDTLKEDNERD